MSSEQKINEALIEELLRDQDPQTVFQQEGLLGALKKALAERILDTEMDVHLSTVDEQARGNHRNGRSAKQVLTDSGTLELSIPRDRQGRFEPQLIEKYRRRFPGFDEKVIALYARGLSTREIRGHFPSDRAASKLIYLVLRKIEAKWTLPPPAWHQARAQFAIYFGDRFTGADS